MRPHRQPHLSRHEGYAIDRPTEFFHQYGDYMLGVLETYKVDIITNRPPDMSSTGVHEMTGKNAPSDASPPITNIESRVQQAIEFLQGKSQANLGHGGSYKPRAVDMEQVGSFINGHLTDKTLAQLCKVQTSDGTVDWVCWEHFRRQYGPRQLSNFWRVLKRSQDILEEHLGGLVMTLNTSAEAVQLYKAMEEAPGLVQELKLTLKWEVPVADMLALRDAVYRANVRHLTLSYTPSKAKSEFMNKKKRSGPLWDMIGNKKLRSFTLDGKTGLLSKMAHEIQPFSLVSLRISECVNWKKHSARILDIIKMGVNLTELRMGCLEIEEPYHAILKTLQKQNNNVMPSNSIMSNKDSNTNSSNSSLRILALTTSPTDNVTLQLSSASPIAMSLTISSLDNTILERTTVLRSLHIRPKMNSALVGVRDRVEAIVSRNPELAKLNIQCQLSEFIELFQIMRTIALGSRNQVKALTLYRDRNKLYTTNIRNDGATSLELLSLNEPKEVLEALFEQYGSRLTKLRCNTPRYVPDSLFELLLLATRFTGSRLTELTLDIRSVGVSALEDLQRVVLRSQELKVLQIDLTMAFDLVAGGEWVQFITSVESKLTQIRVVKAFVDRWRMALQRSAVLAAEMILLMEDHIPFRRQIKDADMAMIARNCAAY
ncbi:hypothetical protein BGZ94_008326 [Podila epigama]|nr:hypothetical protein BGZ94_008326 [Podila epigama]